MSQKLMIPIDNETRLNDVKIVNRKEKDSEIPLFLNILHPKVIKLLAII